MSKAVLVIDMPKRCKDCFRYRADAWFGGSCTQVKEENGWNKQIGADDEYSVQNWCPLRPYKNSISIEWIKNYARHKASKGFYEIDCYWHFWEDDVLKMVADWEKENEID